jgi:hypothetical protein
MLLSLGKKIFFFHRRLFRRRLTFRAGDLFLKRAYIPKTTSPFSGGVLGNLIEILLSEV